jgi:CubicO group peptidase (beta-lactamase class C family)
MPIRMTNETKLRNSSYILPMARTTVLILVLLLGGEVAAATPAEAIDDLVTRYTRLGRFSGAVLAARDGKVIHAGGYGLANREHRVANRADTKFMLGSLAKQFTAAAILKLEREGRLSVHDRIVKHLPSYPRPQGEKVTIHHLLTHSSGIPSLGRRGDGLEFVDKELARPVTLSDVIGYSKDLPLLFEPGSQYRYSNSGYGILAAIVEQVSGKPFEEYLRTELFAPAGLHATGVLSPDRIVPDLADGYEGFEPEVKRARYEHPAWGVGSGNAYSTVFDLLAWERAIRGNEKLFAPHIARSGGKSHYGYGWFIDEIDGRRVISHGGTTAGYVCEMYRLPDQGITVIVLSNHLPKLGVHVPGEIADSTVRILMGETPASVPPALGSLPETVAAEIELAPGYRIATRREGARLFARAVGAKPWTLFTWKTMKDLDADDPVLRRALDFVERLRKGQFEQVVESLAPTWRAKAKPADFGGPWQEWIAEHGALVDVAPFSLERNERVDVAGLLLQFERRIVHLEVVQLKSGEIAGWWENADVPQREVELFATTTGELFADGFRYRLPDVLAPHR